jgi:hypothetical protein
MECTTPAKAKELFTTIVDPYSHTTVDLCKECLEKFNDIEKKAEEAYDNVLKSWFEEDNNG